MHVPAKTCPPATPRRALLLDRDGTINVDKRYVHKPEDFELLPGIVDVMLRFHAAGYVLIIATNQAGIARGYYTEEEFLRFDAWMRAFLLERFAVPIARTYYAPDHPEGTVPGYRRESDERKPNPGMLLAAKTDFGLDLATSVLLGDKESDIEAGRRAGIGLNVLLAPLAPPESRADLVIATLPELLAHCQATGWLAP
jgi:D-glycero-D-manno-heptose 1,7-bisphosphate phosphatase